MKSLIKLKSFWSVAVIIAAVPLILLFAMGSVQAQQFVPAPGMISSNSAWTVYAFGNAQAVSDAFRAIANFSNSSVFRNLVGLLAIIGVLMVGVSSGFSALIAKKFMSYAVFVFLVVYLLFGVGGSGPISTHVEVTDTVDGTWKAPVTVPAIVGIPAAIISGAGYYLTQQAEASFTMPDEMKLSNGAPFNLAATLLSDMSKAKIQNPALANSFAYYVQDCFIPAVAQNKIPASTLLDSTNFLKDIEVDFVSVLVNTTLSASPIAADVGTPKLVSCVDAYKYIKTAIESEGSEATAFLNQASSWHTTPALSVVNAAADQVALWASNGELSGAGGSMVKQAAVLSAFRPAFAQAAAATGNSDFLTTIAVTQATETQKNSWLIGAEIFNRMMGYFFAVLQVFIYALTPLILAAALIPSLGMSLLKNFAQVLIWLALWQPMLAIVNFVVLSMQKSALGGALSTGGAYGFAMNNIGVISERAANLTAAATMIGAMVPILAWAFVKGSVDFSRMVGSAVGENFAQSAGGTLTTGNYSLNSASMDSFTANKTSVSSVFDAGNGYSVSGTQPISHKMTTGDRGLSMYGTNVGMNNSDSKSLLDSRAITDGTAQQRQGSQSLTGAESMAIATAFNHGANGNWQVGSQGVTDARMGATLGVGGSRAPMNPNGSLNTRDGIPRSDAVNSGDASSLPQSETGDKVRTTPPSRTAQVVDYMNRALGPVGLSIGASGAVFRSDGTQIGQIANFDKRFSTDRGQSSSNQALLSASEVHSTQQSEAANYQRSSNMTAPSSWGELSNLYESATRPPDFGNEMAASMGIQSARFGVASAESDIARRYSALTGPDSINKDFDARIDKFDEHRADALKEVGERVNAAQPSNAFKAEFEKGKKSVMGDLATYAQGANRDALDRVVDQLPPSARNLARGGLNAIPGVNFTPTPDYSHTGPKDDSGMLPPGTAIPKPRSRTEKDAIPDSEPKKESPKEPPTIDGGGNPLLPGAPGFFNYTLGAASQSPGAASQPGTLASPQIADANQVLSPFNPLNPHAQNGVTGSATIDPNHGHNAQLAMAENRNQALNQDMQRIEQLASNVNQAGLSQDAKNRFTEIYDATYKHRA